MAKSTTLLKFTGDLKALPYRELMEFAESLKYWIAMVNSAEPVALAQAMVKAAVDINPDQEDTEAPRRQSLTSKIGGAP
jgi:hypothetical protein